MIMNKTIVEKITVAFKLAIKPIDPTIHSRIPEYWKNAAEIANTPFDDKDRCVIINIDEKESIIIFVSDNNFQGRYYDFYNDRTNTVISISVEPSRVETIIRVFQILSYFYKANEMNKEIMNMDVFAIHIVDEIFDNITYQEYQEAITDEFGDLEVLFNAIKNMDPSNRLDIFQIYNTLKSLEEKED